MTLAAVFRPALSAPPVTGFRVCPSCRVVHPPRSLAVRLLERLGVRPAPCRCASGTEAIGRTEPRPYPTHGQLFDLERLYRMRMPKRKACASVAGAVTGFP